MILVNASIVFLLIDFIFIYPSSNFDSEKLNIFDTLHIILLIISLIALPIVCVVVNSPVTTVNHAKSASTDIESVNLTSSASGSFFLGTGTVDNQPVYYYMVKTADGDQLQSLNNSENNVFIKQDADGQPTLEKKVTYSTKKIKNQAMALFFDPITILKQIIGYDPEYNYTEKYIFHVPAGTVVQQYKVDTQSIQ